MPVCGVGALQEVCTKFSSGILILQGETTILVEGVPFETFAPPRPDSVSSSSEDNSSSSSSSAASTVPMVVESPKA